MEKGSQKLHLDHFANISNGHHLFSENRTIIGAAALGAVMGTLYLIGHDAVVTNATRLKSKLTHRS